MIGNFVRRLRMERRSKQYFNVSYPAAGFMEFYAPGAVVTILGDNRITVALPQDAQLSLQDDRVPVKNLTHPQNDEGFWSRIFRNRRDPSPQVSERMQSRTAFLLNPEVSSLVVDLNMGAVELYGSDGAGWVPRAKKWQDEENERLSQWWEEERHKRYRPGRGEEPCLPE